MPHVIPLRAKITLSLTKVIPTLTKVTPTLPIASKRKAAS